jgi:hypothetical protein
MSTRYLDQGFPLLHWATEIEAICPKCNCVGVVNGNPYWRDWRATFLCHGCSHSLKTDRDGWHGPVLGMGRRPCGTCGFQWIHVEKVFDDTSKVMSDSVKSKCTQCKSENEVSLKFTRSEPVDHAIDRFFGLELALKEDTRHGVLSHTGRSNIMFFANRTSSYQYDQF